MPQRLSVDQRIPSSRAAGRRGFALLITITLLAFLVLILVSLATLTRVETAVADNSRRLDQARQNALLSLNLALGQLQRYAGPDQRVTATADIGGTTSIAGVPAAADGRRHWLGVWGNAAAPSAESASPLLLNWLVSGNEDASFGSTNGAPPYAAVSGVSFRSADAVTGLSVSSGPLSDLGTSASPFRLLVGAGSAGADVSRYVAAPLRDIAVQASTLPGFASTDSSAKTVGRYAWWIGDEGVKARVNLLDPHATKTGADVGERGYSFVVSQRSAAEWVAAGTGTLGSDYPAFSTQLPDVGVLSQLSFASSASATVDEAMKERFHDLTTVSQGVLADVRLGGLKKDLTRALAPGAPVSAETARGENYSPAVDRDWLFDPLSGSSDAYGVPTWGLLRAYAARQVAVGGQVPSAAPVRGSSGGNYFYDDTGVAPVITYAGVGMDFTSPGADPSASYPAPINLNLFPVVVLWNPYTVALGGGDYTVAIGVRTASRLQLREGSTSGAVRATVYLNRAGFASSGANAYFRFKLSCPTINPGESVIFMLAGDATYQPGQTVLVPGLNPSASASMGTGATLTDSADAAKNFAAYATNSSGTAAFGGGEIDAILAAYDPAGLEPSGQDPETASTAWFAVAQRVGSSAGTTPAARPLNSDTTTSDMLFGLRVRFNFPDSGSGLKLQWIAHGNARSPLLVRTKLDSWIKTSDGTTAGYSSSYSGRFGPASPWPDFSTTVAQASAGRALAVGSGGPTNVTLWEFPTPNLGLLSTGQLQHAPVSILGAYPSYAIGNSLQDFRVPRTATSTTTDTHPATSNQYATARISAYYDISWRLNRTLWDRYFFSSTPTGVAPSRTTGAAWTQTDIDADNPLPNSRLSYYREGTATPSIDQLVKGASASSDPFNQAAANLLLAGAFNVNSTSEQAWRAVLAGVNQLAYDPRTHAVGTALQAAFARFATPTADSALGTPWEGYRQLDEAEVATLAANIVAEVRKRGPFLSLADFVNRRLASDETGLKGALQAAIDTTTTGDAANLAATSPFNVDRVDNAPNTGESYDAEAMRNDPSSSINAAHRSRSAFAPKFLTQADVLTVIGPSLAARSDTFVIRAYGESTDPLLTPSDAGFVTGRAWCEAVVQRTPGYVDRTDAALGAGDLADALSPADVGADNQTFGRRFRIVSFRWLNPSDI